MKTVKLEGLNHVGVRVRDLGRSVEWYGGLGFHLLWQSEPHKVACLRNDEIGVELTLIFNSNDSNGGKNVLMDVEPKYPKFNHLSFRVHSIQETIDTLGQQASRSRRGLSHSAAKSRCSFATQTSMSWSLPKSHRGDDPRLERRCRIIA